jgi:hypothetical protein
MRTSRGVTPSRHRRVPSPCPHPWAVPPLYPWAPAPMRRILYLLSAPLKIPLVYCLSSASDEHPVVARPWPGGEKRIGGQASHHEESEAIGSLLLPYAATGVSLLAVGCLSGATPRGQPWTSAGTLPHGCNGLGARRMAVVWTFREPSLGRHVHRALLRSALLDMTPMIPATACHQRNDVERYSRFKPTGFLRPFRNAILVFQSIMGFYPRKKTNFLNVCTGVTEVMAGFVCVLRLAPRTRRRSAR